MTTPPALVEELIRKGDLNGAIKVVQDLLAAGAGSESEFSRVVQELAARKMYTVLIQSFEPYAERFKDSVTIQWGIGAGYANLMRYAPAMPYFERVLQLRPDSFRPYHQIGRIYFSSGRHDAAIKFFKEAIERTPDPETLFECYHRLSVSQTDQGQLAEALASAKKAAALKPTDKSARDNLADLEKIANVPSQKMAFARWPESARDFGDVRSVIDNYVTKNIPTGGIALRRGMSVMTQGSCFARNLARSLQRYDLSANALRCGEEHNNTFANRAVIDWLRDGVHDEPTEIVEANMGPDAREGYLANLRDADLFVYTMGLAPAHFDRVTGAFVMPRSTDASRIGLFRRCVFRTSSVQENVDNLLHIVGTVRQLAPKAGVILTVSPVPLRMTTEFHSAVVADCVSKSVLRVAVHEVIGRNLPKTIYWPSFEMVRWLGGHGGGAYGADDGSSHHVNLALIDQVMDSFIDVFGDDELKATRTAT